MSNSKSLAAWRVNVSPKVSKQIKKIPVKVLDSLVLLIKDIEAKGPIQKDWPYFRSLEKLPLLESYHCEIKDGRPVFVACWQVTNKRKQLVEILYFGTSKNAPFKA